jgi:putative membrane protein
MNRNLILTTAAVAALSLTAACSKPTNSGTDPNSASNQTANTGAMAPAAATVDKAQDATAAAVGTVAAAMPTDAQGFVTAMATSDMYEIQAAKIAQTRSTSPKVKAFAAKMIHDHSATTAELKAILAKGSATNVTPPTDLDQRRQGMIDNLKSADAGAFDKTYLDQQVAAHTEAESTLNNYGGKGDNDALKAFATKTAPKVQMHLDMAKGLDDAAGSTSAKTPG